MQLIRYRPSAPLNTYVDMFWWSHRDCAGEHSEHMLPSGGVQMIFALHHEPIIYIPGSSARNSLSWSRAVVHGPQWGFYKTAPKPAGTTVGIAFRAGMAGSILGVPIAELTDCHVSVDALWGTRGHGLRERLLGAKSPHAVFRLLEAELIVRSKRAKLIHPGVSNALVYRTSGWPAIRVAHIQRDSGFSPRHFAALFREAVGLTPKHYYRIKRFTAVLKGLASSDPENLADLATSVVYSDQAHLTREFREFAGVTPTQYRPRDSTSILHHRAHDTPWSARKVRNIQDSHETKVDNPPGIDTGSKAIGRVTHYGRRL